MGWLKGAFNDRMPVNVPELAERSIDTDRVVLDKGHRALKMGDVVSDDELRIDLEIS